jgi:hypothetical protein
VNNVLDACFPCGVDESLALGQHCDGVSGKQEDSIYAVKGRGEGSWIVQVKEDCITALLL